MAAKKGPMSFGKVKRYALTFLEDRLELAKLNRSLLALQWGEHSEKAAKAAKDADDLQRIFDEVRAFECP